MEQFVEEILAIIKSKKTLKEKRKLLQKYHENDIAEVIPQLSEKEKNDLFKILNDEDLSEVISYADDADKVIDGLNNDEVADILEDMDSDDAVDILEDMDDKDRNDVLSKMEDEAREDATMILSYPEDSIGRLMTTNYIVINKDDTITSAMKKLIKQSGDNDNITTIFVVDDNEKYYGAVDLKDLIRARKETSLEDITVTNYPCVNANSKSSEVYQDVIDYGEDIIPVVDDNDILIGALTAHDLVEVIDNEKNEDYQKFAAINGNVDLDSSVFTSIKKRAPWLILLLFLGFVVSILLSSFSNVISALTTMVFFQSVVLDMAGNAALPKDKDLYPVLELVLEMYERGIKFLPVDLYESDATKFKMEPEGIRPPLNSVPGLGTVAALSIQAAREEEKFMCIDDLQMRGKVGKSVIEVLSKAGCLEGMTQSNQMSLFA